MKTVEHRISTWVDIVGDLIRGPAEPFPEHLISARLHETFGTQVSWNWLDPDGRVGFDLYLPMPGWPTAEHLDIMASAIFDHPLIRWFDASGDPSPMSIGRVPRQLMTARASAVVRDVLVPIGMDAQLSIPYQLGAGSHRAYVLSRGGDDFSSDDLHVARHVQTLLRLLDRQARVFDTNPASSTDGHGLTGRQLAVLRLLADGLTATTIAHRLGISPRTVHRHLDATYRKLGVADRVSAVLAGWEAGLLPCRDGHRTEVSARNGRPAWSGEVQSPAVAENARHLYTYTARLS